MGDTLPLAIAIAASPFPVIPAILLLFTARPRATSWSFLGGWFVGVATATTIFALLSGVIETLEEQPTWLSVVRVVLGAALVVWGIRLWVTRHASTELPAWMAALDTATPRSAVRLALLLSLANPKIALLAAAAGLSLGAAEESAAAIAVSILVFTAIASLGVAIPILLYAVRGERVLEPLGKARNWLQRNNSAVMAVVFLVIGLALVAKGASAL